MRTLRFLCALSFLCTAPAGSPAREGAVDAAPSVRFEEEAVQRGVTFEHVIGDSGERYMQECMGSGVALFDADGDGDLDLYLVNGAPLPGWPAAGRPVPTNVLYRNRGDGTFEDVTEKAGVGDRGYGMGVAVGDVDNDGDADLYVLNHGPNVLYLNRGNGTFEDATEKAGVGDPAWSSSAVFFDADADGDLDLFVVNYCDASVENHKWCGQEGREWRGYCTPQVYDALPDTYYRNEGGGRFVSAAREAGLVDVGGKGLGVVPFDYDNDGDVDLYVANDSTPNQLWRNDGTGHFQEVGLLAGVAYSEDGRSEAGMGTDAGDYDGDGHLDLVVTNMDYETNSLLRNSGRVFEHAGYPAGVAAASLGAVGFGVNWLDVDNDGDLDLLVANGHIMDNIEMYNDALSYAQPNALFLNGPQARFREIGKAAGVGESNVARGSAVGDLDGDGRLDLVISRNRGRPGLFLNRSRAGHWLQVRAIGTASNRSGYGARITVEAGGRRQVREVRAARSYQSSSDSTVHIGLGTAGSVESLCVRWPSGRVEQFAVQRVDHLLTVVEGKGQRGETCEPDGEPSRPTDLGLHRSPAGSSR